MMVSGMKELIPYSLLLICMQYFSPESQVNCSHKFYSIEVFDIRIKQLFCIHHNTAITNAILIADEALSTGDRWGSFFFLQFTIHKILYIIMINTDHTRKYSYFFIFNVFESRLPNTESKN